MIPPWSPRASPDHSGEARGEEPPATSAPAAPNGATRILRVLVDTGAQINLVKRDLFEMMPVGRKLRFASADRSAIQGGDSVQKLSLALVPPESKGTESASGADGQHTRARHRHRRPERSTWSTTSGRLTYERT